MSKNGRFFLGALFGASIAGVAALLYAPKSGKELRRDIANEIDRLVEETEEYVDYAVERGVEMYDTASVATDDIKVNLKESANKFKSQFQDVKGEASHEWDRVKEELVKSKDNIKNSTKDITKTVKEEAGHLAEDIKISAELVKESAQESADNIADELN